MRKSSREDAKAVVFTHFTVQPDDSRDDLLKRWTERFVHYKSCSKQLEHVFVFVSEGYEALMSIPAIEPPWPELLRDRELVKTIEDASRKARCAEGYIVPIGYVKLMDVVARIQRRAKYLGRNVALLLLGSGKFMRYDSPKFIDAILRIDG